MERLVTSGLILGRTSSSTRLHEKLSRWSEPPSATEIEKCERAERMIKEAIADDPKLSKMNITVFAKGSYANRTNIPSDSDIDIGVLADDQYFNDYPEGKTDRDFNFSDSGYSFAEFSQNVAAAIIRKFGTSEVKPDEKCIKVRSNTCRVDADVVPHFKHRRYWTSGGYNEGVAIYTPERKIYNWPEQDYKNGVAKNEATSRRYKGFVRILKTLRGEMESAGVRSSKHAKSYLISCLMWNVPNNLFEGNNYGDVLSTILDFLISQTSDYSKVKEWGEVNELKYLFRASQPWKLEEVNLFLREAKDFLGKI